MYEVGHEPVKRAYNPSCVGEAESLVWNIFSTEPGIYGCPLPSLPFRQNDNVVIFGDDTV
jgi:hypothetical protein